MAQGERGGKKGEQGEKTRERNRSSTRDTPASQTQQQALTRSPPSPGPQGLWRVDSEALGLSPPEMKPSPEPHGALPVVMEDTDCPFSQQGQVQSHCCLAPVQLPCGLCCARRCQTLARTLVHSALTAVSHGRLF